MSRNIKKIMCQICNKEYSSVGIATHLKSAHSISVDDYVKKFGEFRKNKLNKKLDDTEMCLICNDHKKYNSKGLSWHIKKEHGIDKIEYIKKYILNNVIPVCKCGCGEELTIKHYHPYVTSEYKSGHNSKGVRNPRYGVSITPCTRKKMKDSAISRTKNYKKLGIPLAYHRPESIERRGKTYSINHMIKKMKKYNVEIMSSYEDQQKNIYSFKCLTCNSTFLQHHNSYFLCSNCHPRIRSKQEHELFEFLVELGIKNISKNNRTFLGNGMELDIYLPDYKLAIEYNGLYYHSEVAGKKDKKYHINKTELCLQKGIKLIHIFEDEYLNKPNIVKSKLKILLNKTDNFSKIAARKCTIKEISSSVKNKFLDQYHLQGKDNSSIRLGMFYEGELISVMTFQKTNISKGKIYGNDVYEMSRFCNKWEVLVIGAASKFISHFKKNVKFYKIITFADLRWTGTPTVYDKIGFKLVSQTSPNYWYFHPSSVERKHRFNFTKHKLVSMGHDSNLTEWEIMKSLKYDRIWDCGHLKYELIV